MMNERSTVRWFRPPRAHGDVDEDRSVSFLELFYDLVFVVLIAQIAHTLADHVTWTGVRDFVVVFGLIWIAWLNGTLYHDLHGGEDGRSRTYIFIQMAVLVVLAVYAAHAADDAADGRAFAIVYTLLLLVIGWQWFDVRRFDSPEWRVIATRYVLGMALITAIVFASAFVSDPETRLLLWAVAVVITLLGNLLFALQPQPAEMERALHPTESLVERFGLFTIIVLGEVVVGVADGLSAVERTFTTIATGILALWIGFGFWWNYFDFVGGRQPRVGRSRTSWLFVHLPLTVAISAAGAGMVGLIEHAGDARTPAPTAWLLGGATAGVALSIALLTTTIGRHPARQAFPYTLAAAALGSLVLAALRPAPWLLAAALGTLL
ncbi:MAG: low temperature requirement protein A, partial [Acidimicrobiales bacterium]